jgi:O-antigen/teichoic acid export membrane protein
MAKGLVGDVRQNLEKYLKLMIVVAMPVAVGGTLLAPKLIGLVAGQEFAPAAPVLSILIWAVAILFIYIPVNSLVISQLTKKALVVTGVNVVVNVVGNILLLPILGIKAAAIMTVASELLQGIFYFYFVKTAITQFNFWGILKKPLVASLIMGLSLWPLKELSLLLSVPVGAVVYVLILLALGFVTAEDIKIVKNLSQA